MAELYLARTLGLEGFEKLVVVKRILPQYAANASFVSMFVGEARLAATLHHPNVAQVYEIGNDDGDYFFAMEYVHGEDLDRIAAQSHEQGVPLSLDAALTLGAGLCAGLHYAHERIGPDGVPLAIVHRDVSPSNVLVGYDGSVKLVDFGIARATSRTTSGPGGLKGKIAFMSPEQCRADLPLDRRSDIYAVGTLLYELTTSRPTFAGETDYAILNQIVNVDVPPPRRFVPDYPEALERIVLRALARDPAQRYATALELQSALEDFAHESRLRISPLVLARIMGTLFPARLEEWDDAKSQGAFFVEQHVVRTLIESGKTPDPNDPATRAYIEAALNEVAESESAAASQSPAADGGTATQVRVPAAPTGSRAPIALGLAVPAGGTLVSSSHPASAARPPVPLEVTQRVQLPRAHTSPGGTPRSRKRTLAALAALVLAGAATATAIALRVPGATSAPGAPPGTATTSGATSTLPTSVAGVITTSAAARPAETLGASSASAPPVTSVPAAADLASAAAASTDLSAPAAGIALPAPLPKFAPLKRKAPHRRDGVH